MVSVHDGDGGDALGDLARFRGGFYGSLTARADALFELTDALLCTEGPVHTLVGLSLAPEHRRGHGALYDGLDAGRLDVARFRGLLAGQPLPRAAGGRLMLAVDVSNWLRPDAATSPDRLFCHTYGRGKGQAQMIPGWPYSVIAALEPGRSSWTALLDAVRLGPACDAATVTAAQLRELVERLIAAGQWQPGDPRILIVADAGYDPARLAHALADLPVEVLARLRSDRVFARPAPQKPRSPRVGRPPRHGGLFRFTDPGTWHTPSVTTSTPTQRYGTAAVTAWDRMHPRLTHRSAWLGHDGLLPVIEGTLIRLVVEYLPGDRNPKPVWLWTSATDLPACEVDRAWQAFLRRFDLEHTFRMLKQTLGWTCPRLRDPEAGDRWTWLIIAAHTQLRLARSAASDLRRPWEKPVTELRKLTPARVRRGFRNLRAKIAVPARAPKPSRPGPGRPPGTRNRRHATRHDVGKITKRPTSQASTQTETG
ncbi:MAG: NF041680 family putative transposase [Nocardioidaceae bacterium]